MTLEKEFRKESLQRYPTIPMTNEEKQEMLQQLPVFMVVNSPIYPKQDSIFKKIVKTLIILTLGLQLGYLIHITRNPNIAPSVIKEYKTYPDFN